jgi:hypothetical protein
MNQDEIRKSLRIADVVLSNPDANMLSTKILSQAVIDFANALLDREWEMAFMNDGGSTTECHYCQRDENENTHDEECIYTALREFERMCRNHRSKT